MWNGIAHFGRGWALYRGYAADQRPHAHAAVQVAISDGGPLEVEMEGNFVLEGDVLLIGPMTKHRLRPTQGVVTLIYVDLALPFAQAALAGINPRQSGQAPEALAAALRAARNDTQQLKAIVEEGNSSIDQRLERAIEEMVRSRRSHTIALAVRNNGLSPQRARHLARKQLGAPMKTILLWRKLEIAAREIAAGSGLAAAAASAGFADQAHLTRTMKHMFGVTPGDAAHPLQKKE